MLPHPTYNEKEFEYFVSGKDDTLKKFWNNKVIILLQGRKFGNIILNCEIEVSHEVWIEDCEFSNLEIHQANFTDRFIIKRIKTRNLTFRGGNYKQGLFINNSTIEDGITFYKKDDVTFSSSSVSIENNSANYISIQNLNFEYLNLSQNEVRRIRISNSLIFPETSERKFEHLFSKVKSLNFILNEKTKMIVDYQEIEKLTFSGSLNNAEVSFNKIKVKELTFREFTKVRSGILNLSRIRPFDKNSKVIILNSYLGDSNFYDCDFASFSSFGVANSFFLEIVYAHTTFPKKIVTSNADWYSPSPYSSYEASIQLRETFRQLKIAASKQGDKLQEAKFYRNEMLYLNKTLSLSGHLSTRLSLFLGLISNNHKQNWFLPIIWLFTINASFVITLFSHNLSDINFNWITFFNLLNPAHRFNDLEIAKNFCTQFIDFGSRVINSFLIYQTITAFRKLS